VVADCKKIYIFTNNEHQFIVWANELGLTTLAKAITAKRRASLKAIAASKGEFSSGSISQLSDAVFCCPVDFYTHRFSDRKRWKTVVEVHVIIAM
jgi:hypothetical protein